MILSVMLLSILAYVLYNGIELWLLGHHVLSNTNVSLETLPKISIIIPACNEENQIRQAITTMLDCDYPNKEIIIINDRSTDNTATIINELAHNSTVIKAIHIDKLPTGWMGKNHALYQGTQQATGEWFLFTDADVHFDKTILKNTLRIVQEQNLDHLAIFPKIKKATLGFDMMIVLITTLFYFLAKPWRAQCPGSKCSVGVGAFNLIKASTYQKMGGHQKIALNSDDDVKLGQLIKSQGYRQNFYFAKESLQVKWYASLSELIHGLEKNTFAHMNYSLLTVIFFTLFSAALFYLPIAGLLLCHGFDFMLSVMNVAFSIAIFTLIARRFHYPIYYGISYPITLMIMYYATLRSVYLTYKNKGVYWRDTFYPIEQIKNNYLKTNF